MSKIDKFLNKIAPYNIRIWSTLLIATLATTLFMNGRFIGVGVGLCLIALRSILPKIQAVESFRRSYKIPTIVQTLTGLMGPILLGSILFITLNTLPIIGDLGFRNYKGVMVLLTVFLGVGYLILNETDRQNKYILPLIMISGVGLVSFGISTVDYDYLLFTLLLIFGQITLWDWWFESHNSLSNLSRSAMMLALPVSIFIYSQISSHLLIKELFPSGLLIQYFFALPGLFSGIFFGIYLAKFKFRKSSWIIVPLVPVTLSIILGIEAGVCYWMTLGFTLLLMSILDPNKTYLYSGFSLGTTLLMTLLMPQLHIPYELIGTEVRSAIAISVIVFWLIVTLFTNQVRRDWSLENLAKIRTRRRRQIRR